MYIMFNKKKKKKKHIGNLLSWNVFPVSLDQTTTYFGKCNVAYLTSERHFFLIRLPLST